MGIGHDQPSSAGVPFRPSVDHHRSSRSLNRRDHPTTAPAYVLAALCLGAFSFGTAEFSVMTFLPQLARNLHVSEPRASLLVSLYAIGVVIGAPVITLVAASLPRRGLLLALLAWFAAANGLSAVATSFGELVVFRFAAGLPHGAYLGIAALVAAGQVESRRKAWAVSRVFLGLTVATLVGVPLASWLSQAFSWRLALWIVSCLAAVSGLLLFFAPTLLASARGRPLQELRSLRNPQVWLTLAIGAIGFGGMFCVYAYLGSTLVEITGLPSSYVPAFFCLFGLGLTIGNIVAPTFADRAALPSAGGVLLWSVAALVVYPLAARSPIWIGVDILLIGGSQALGVVLQTRLMEVAGDAQALPAALNHSAFNIANAIGPAIGGLAISRGLGWTAIGPVGASLAGCGLLVWVVAMSLNRRTRKGN